MSGWRWWEEPLSWEPEEEEEERCPEDCPGFYVHVDPRDGSRITLPCSCAAPWPASRWWPGRPEDDEDPEEVPF